MAKRAFCWFAKLRATFGMRKYELILRLFCYGYMELWPGVKSTPQYEQLAFFRSFLALSFLHWVQILKPLTDSCKSHKHLFILHASKWTEIQIQICIKYSHTNTLKARTQTLKYVVVTNEFLEWLNRVLCLSFVSFRHIILICVEDLWNRIKCYYWCW